MSFLVQLLQFYRQRRRTLGLRKGFYLNMATNAKKTAGSLSGAPSSENLGVISFKFQKTY